MNSQHAFNVFLGSMYVFGLVFATFAFIYGGIKQQRDKARLSSAVEGKLSKAIDVSGKDVRVMANGLKVCLSAIAPLIARLMVGTDDPDLYRKVRTLSDEIAKEEPLSDLPADLRPFFARLTELCMASPHPGDHAMLNPIHASVVSLNELANKKKARERFLTWLSILGFFIGAWGTYLTWTSPNAKDIQAIVQKSVRENLVQQSAAPSTESASAPVVK
jgi:hypothetical protein